MSLNSLYNYINQLSTEISSIQSNLAVVEEEYIAVDDRIYTVENFLSLNSANIPTSSTSNIDKFLKISSFNTKSTDSNSLISLQNVIPSFEKPIITYTTNRLFYVNLNNSPVIININDYFISLTGDTLTFYPSINISNIRPNLYRPEYGTNIYSIENMSILNLIPDYRDTRYSITFQAIDSSKFSLSNFESYLSEPLIVDILESPVPPIYTIGQINHRFVDVQPYTIKIDDSNYFKHSINEDYKDIYLYYTYDYIDNTYNPLNISLDTSNNLTVHPNYRGLNGKETTYTINIVATDSVYSTTSTLRLNITEPPPISNLYADYTYKTQRNQDYVFILENLFTSFESDNFNFSLSISGSNIRNNLYIPNLPLAYVDFDYSSNIHKLYIKADYRDSSNVISIRASKNGYLSQPTYFNIIFIETFPLTPDLTINTINYSMIPSITYNLNDYFRSRTQNTQLYFSFKGSYNNSLFSINNSNLTINPILTRYQSIATTTIQAYDHIYSNYSISNLNVNLTLQASIETLPIPSLLDLSIYTSSIDLSKYYLSPIGSRLKYFYTVNKEFNNITINNSNLVIVPQYRNTSYQITVYGYDELYYPQYSNDYPISFIVSEKNPPPPVPYVTPLAITIGYQQCNLVLTNLFNIPTDNPITYTISPISTSTPILYELYQTSNIVFYPNLRGITYLINVTAKDIVYNAVSSTPLTLRVTETIAVNTLKDIPDLFNLSNQPIDILLLDYFSSPLNNIIEFTVSTIDNIRSNIKNSNLPPYFLLGETLRLFPDYREAKYELIITATDPLFPTKGTIQKFFVTELAQTFVNPTPSRLYISTFNGMTQTFNLDNYFQSTYYDVYYEIKNPIYRDTFIPEINLVYDGDKLYYANILGEITNSEFKFALRSTEYLVSHASNLGPRVRNALQDIFTQVSPTLTSFITANSGNYSYGGDDGKKYDFIASRSALYNFVTIENNLLNCFQTYDPNFPIYFLIECYRVNVNPLQPKVKLNNIDFIVNRPDIVDINLTNLVFDKYRYNLSNILSPDYQIRNDIVYSLYQSESITWASIDNEFLVVDANFRGYSYNIIVHVKDYTDTLLTEINYHVNEIPSIIVNQTSTFNRSITDLKDYPISCNISTLFTNNVWFSNISFEYILNYENNSYSNFILSNIIETHSNLRNGYYNGQKPVFDFNLPNSNLVLYPEFRNIDYSLTIIGYIAGWYQSNVSVTINVHENLLDDISLKINPNKNFFNLQNNKTTITLNNYIDYRYFEHLDIYPIVSNLANTRDRPFKEPYIDSSNNLILQPNYSFSTYNVVLHAYDSNFHYQNLDLYFNVSEKGIRGNKWFIDSYFLSNQPPNLNLPTINTNLFDLQNYFISDMIWFQVELLTSNVRNGYYNNKPVYEFDSSNLFIYPEYRGHQYNLKITAGVKRYDPDPNYVHINIIESNIPPIVFNNNFKIDYSNLLKDSLGFNLRQYFTSYPYYDKLVFSSNILTDIPSNRKPYDVHIQDSNLSIHADLRDLRYEINIKATDVYFSQSNSELTYIIQEEPPLYYSTNTYGITLSNLTDISTGCNLDVFFTPSIPSNDISYSNQFPDVRDGFYNGLPALQIVDSNLTINPEFRDTTYTAYFQAYIKGYEEQYLDLYYHIHEERIPPILLKSTYVNRFSNLTKIDVECNLSEYFEYHYLDKLFYQNSNFDFDIDIKILDISNLVITPDLRNSNYYFNIRAYDPFFQIENLDLNFYVHEKAPIEIYPDSYVDFFSNLSSQARHLDLKLLFLNNWDASNIVFVITDSNIYSEFPDPYYHIGHHNNNCNIIYFDNDVISLYPEYRGDIVSQYFISFEASLNNYPQYVISYTIHANELPLPTIRLKSGSNVDMFHYIGLSNNRIELNLFDLIDASYPFLDSISFDATPSIQDLHAQIINNRSIVWNANLRGLNGHPIDYFIDIDTFDTEYKSRTIKRDVRIDVNELPPLSNVYFHEDVHNLTNRQITCNLDLLFISGLSGCNIFYSSNVTNNPPVGRYNNHVPAILLDDNRMIITPEYRKQFVERYDVIITAFLENYPNQCNIFTYSIYEDQIPPILFKDIKFEHSNLVEDVITSNLRLFYDYVYVNELRFTYNIVTPLKIGSKPYDVALRDLSNISIVANVRDQYYSIDVSAHDDYFSQSNVVMNISVQERHPFYFIDHMDEYVFNNLSNVRHEINLDAYFTKSITRKDLIYVPYFPSLRKGFYDGGLDALVIYNRDIFQINPEYRGQEYNCHFDVYLDGYREQSNIINFRIGEIAIPNILINNMVYESRFSNLTFQTCNIDLSLLFTEYVYSSYLAYSYKITTDLQEGRKNYRVSIKDFSRLEVIADLRDQHYNIEITARDNKFGIFNSNLVYTFHESPTLIFKYGNTIEISGLSNEDVYININDYFDKNKDTEIIHIPYLPVLRSGYYNGQLEAFDIINADVMIHPEYRGQTYDLLFTSFLIGYEGQYYDIYFRVTELPPLTINVKSETFQREFVDLERSYKKFYLFDYFTGYTYYQYLQFDFKVLCNLEKSLKPFDLNIDQQSNLTVNFDFRAQAYDVKITARDPNFLTSNEDLIFRFVEKPPLEYLFLTPDRCNIDLFGLQNYQIYCNLDSLYIHNAMYRDIVHEMQYPVIRDTYHTMLPAVQRIDMSNLYLNPEHRGEKYSIKIRSYVIGYEELFLDAVINISESNIFPIEFNNAIIDRKLLRDEVMRFNLRDYYPTYPYRDFLRFNYYILDQKKPNSKDFDIRIENLSNLVVKADYRDQSYSIRIVAEDDKFVLDNYDLIMSFQERPPFQLLDYNTSNYLMLSDVQIHVMLDRYFMNYHRHNLMQYEFSIYPDHLSVGYYNGGLPVAQLINNSNLYLNPEYRDYELYQVQIRSYVSDYRSQSCNINFFITEESIPQLVLNSSPILKYSNLDDELKIINLNSLYSVYPYITHLRYEFLVLDILDVNKKPYEISIANQSNLVIQTRARDAFYRIKIDARDDNFNQYDNTLMIYMQENPPFEYKNVSNIDVVLNDKNSWLVDLDSYFINNLYYCNILYEFNLPPIIRNAYYDNAVGYAIINESNLVLNPDHRNINYILNVRCYVEDFKNQSLYLNFNVTEGEVPSIVFNQTDIKESNLTNQTRTYNLRHYYNTYPYVDFLAFDFDVLQAFNPNERLYDIHIEQQSNLIVKADYRNRFYQIQIIANDNRFNILNSDMIITIHEKPPISYVGDCNIVLNLQNSSTFFKNVNTLYNNIVFSDAIIHEYVLPSVRDGFYNNKPAIEIIDNSNLYIYPDYRNQTYLIAIKSYVRGYQKQSLDILYTVNEASLAAIPFNNFVVNLTDMMDQTCNYNLYDYYKAYPYYQDLSFSFEVVNEYQLNNIGKPLDISISPTSNLIINMDYRGLTYNIQVFARDNNFGLVNSDFILTFQEKPPIEYAIAGYNTVVLTGLTNLQQEFNLDEYFKINVVGEDIRYIATFPEIPPSIFNNNLAGVELSNSSNFILRPDYRGRSYMVYFDAYIQNYQSQSIRFTYDITEDTLGSISFSGVLISETNVTSNTFNYNLRTYYSDYIFVDKLLFSYEILDLLKTGSKPFDVKIQNQSNLSVSCDYRGQTYRIRILAEDPVYSLTNNEFILTFSEKSPILLKDAGVSSFNINNLTMISQKIDLDTKFINNVLDQNIQYIPEFPTLNIGYYNQTVALEISDRSNLVINPEFRYQTYTAKFQAYINGYDTQKVSILFNITELEIPPLVSTTDYYEYIGLSNKQVTIQNIKNTFNQFPYSNQLIYSLDVFSDINLSQRFINYAFYDIDVNLNADTLIINPNVRGVDYWIQLIVREDGFNLYNCNIKIKINEKRPLDIGEIIYTEGNLSRILSLENAVIDLEGNFVKNIPEYDVLYEVMLRDQIRGSLYTPLSLIPLIPTGAVYSPYTSYGGKRYNDIRSNVAYIEANRYLTISPEYRGKNYNVEVRATLIDPNQVFDYSDQSNYQSFQVRESNLPSININNRLLYNLSNAGAKNVPIEYKLWSLLDSYPFYLDIDYEIKIRSMSSIVGGEKIYDGPEIINTDYYTLTNHVLNITPKFRNQDYALFINAYDRFNSYNSNADLKIEVNEISAISVAVPSKFIGTNREFKIDLRQYYTLDEFTFVVASVPDKASIRSAYYTTKLPWNLEQGSNIVLNPEYRDLSYVLNFTVYDATNNPVIGGSNINVTIQETRINPIKERSTLNLVFQTQDFTSNLTDRYVFDSEKSCNLWTPNTYYDVYPYIDKIQFEIPTSSYYSYNSVTRKITFTPDLRGLSYDINVTAKDTNFNLLNNSHIYSVNELYPLDLIKEYASNLYITGYDNTWVPVAYSYANLNTYYKNNHESALPIKYDIYLNGVLLLSDGTYNTPVDNSIYYAKKQIEIVGNDLNIWGDYRSNSYVVRIDAFLSGYSDEYRRLHSRKEINVTEPSVPRIQYDAAATGFTHANNELNYYLWNQVLTQNNFNLETTYKKELYPFWSKVNYTLDVVNGNTISTINSRYALASSNLAITTLLEDTYNEYRFRINVFDPDNRFKNYSLNSNVYFNIHELGKIIEDVKTPTSYNSEAYGNRQVNMKDLYKLFNEANFIKDNKDYDQIISFNSYLRGDDQGVRGNFREFRNTNIRYGNGETSFVFLNDVRGILYNIDLDLRYIGKDQTSNVNVSFSIQEKYPLELVYGIDTIKFVNESGTDVANGLYPLIDVNTTQIVYLDDLFVKNNTACNMHHEIKRAYIVDDSGYQMRVEDDLVLNYKFSIYPITTAVLTNTVGNNKYSGTIYNVGNYIRDENEIRRPYPSVYSYFWIATNSYISIAEMQDITRFYRATYCFWLKNENFSTTYQKVFYLDGEIIRIDLKQDVVRLKLDQYVFMWNKTADGDWHNYIITYDSNVDGITADFYLDNQNVNTIHSNVSISWMDVNYNQIALTGYLGYTFSNVSFADFRIYNNIINDSLKININRGIVQDELINPLDFRVTNLTSNAYELKNNNQLYIDTDYSGKTYDILLDNYLIGYDTYQKLEYTVRVVEPVYPAQQLETVEVQNATVVLTLDASLSAIGDQAAFEAAFIQSIADSLGIDPLYIEIIDISAGSIVVKFKIKPDITSAISPSKHVVELLSQSNDNTSALFSNLKTKIPILSTGNVLNKVVVPDPVIVIFKKSYTLKYDAVTFNANDGLPMSYLDGSYAYRNIFKVVSGDRYQSFSITDGFLINIRPAARNDTYTVLVSGLDSFLNIEYQYYVTVTEEQADSIVVDTNLIDFTNLVYSRQIYLPSLYTTYVRPLALRFNIDTLFPQYLDKITIDVDQNLIVTGSLSGISYNFNIIAYDKDIEFIPSFVSCNLNIIVSEVIPISLLNPLNKDILSYNLDIQVVSYNVNSYFTTNSCNFPSTVFKFDYHISVNPNLVDVRSNYSNLSIYANLRGISYDINAELYYFENNTKVYSNLDLTFKVSEKIPIDYKGGISSYSISSSGWQQISGIYWNPIYNSYNFLTDLFIINHPNQSCNIKPNNITTASLLDYNGIHKSSDAYALEKTATQSNIVFNPDFRGYTWTLDLEVYLENYSTQTITTTFSITETTLPSLQLLVPSLNYYNLIKTNQTYNLHDAFNKNIYPFMLDLVFTPTSPYVGSFEISNTSNLIMKPNLRGATYTISIATQDSKKASVSNNSLVFNIIELPSLTLIVSNTFTIFSDKIRSFECNIFNNYLTSTCNYNGDFKDIFGTKISTTIADTDFLLNSNSNLVLNTDLRGKQYSIGITAFYKSDITVENTLLRYDVIEEYPIVFNNTLNLSYTALTKEKITCNLYNAYDVILPSATNSDVVFQIIELSVRDGYYNGSKHAAEIEHGSNLVLYPEYRGTTYNFRINAYVNYSHYSIRNNLNVQLTIQEENIPLLQMNDVNRVYDNLYNQLQYVHLLNELDYPFKEFIDYTITSGNTNYAEIRNKDLVFIADEAQVYPYTITIEDVNFNQSDTATYTFTVITDQLIDTDENRIDVWKI